MHAAAQVVDGERVDEALVAADEGLELALEVGLRVELDAGVARNLTVRRRSTWMERMVIRESCGGIEGKRPHRRMARP